MSAYYATTDRISAGVSAAIAAGSTTVFNFGKPVNIKRVVMVVTTAQTSAGAAATFGVRNTDDTSSTTIGSFTVPVSAINTTLKADVAGVKTTALTTDGGGISQPATVTTGRVVGRLDNQPGEIEVNPGQEFWVTIAAGGAGGVATMYVEYQEEGNNPTRFNPADMTVTYS